MKKSVCFLLMVFIFGSCKQIKKDDCLRFTRDIAGKCIRTKTANQMNIGISTLKPTTSVSVSIVEHIEDPSLHMIW